MNNIDEIFDSLKTIHVDIDNPSLAFKEIQRHYFQIFTDLLRQFKRFELKQNTRLFRVRKNVEGLAFIKPQELSFPPRHLTPLGRVNLRGKPYYYCSDKLFTSVLELKPEKNDYFTIAECVLTQDLLLAVIGDNPRYNTNGEQSDALKRFTERITPIITSPIKHELEYIFTATLADVIFSDMNFDGVMYPSFYSKSNSDNYALRTDDLSKKLFFLNARLYKVTEKINQHHVIIKCIAKTNKISLVGDFIWEGVRDCPTHPIDFDKDLRQLPDY